MHIRIGKLFTINPSWGCLSALSRWERERVKEGGKGVEKEVDVARRRRHGRAATECTAGTDFWRGRRPRDGTSTRMQFVCVCGSVVRDGDPGDSLQTAPNSNSLREAREVVGSQSQRTADPKESQVGGGTPALPLLFYLPSGCNRPLPRPLSSSKTTGEVRAGGRGRTDGRTDGRMWIGTQLAFR